MSKVFSSEVQKENLGKNAREKLFTKCDFKIRYPPLQSSEGSLARIKQLFGNSGEKNLGVNKNGFSKQKLKFQYNFEERKRRAEIKRKNFIQKLKNIYNIDVEDLNEDVISEIIMKVRLIENEKRERKQRSTERTITMVNRLLKEQKYKLRETKAQCLPSTSVKSLEVSEGISTETEKSEQNSGSTKVVWEKCPENQRRQNKDLDDFIPSSEEEEEEEEEEEKGEIEVKEVEKPFTCLEIIKSKRKNSPKILTRKPPPCVSFEKYLECTPRRIVFKDFKKNKVYLQDLRITNVGIETIHCRYLGIFVPDKNEGKFPIGVAVRDNVKLRPGLSCSTKIRLCSPEDSNEMKCSIVYETRRKNKCFEYSWFFVPVACTPARAVIKVTPMRVIFPAFTWCAATGSENADYLKKILKIENTGGKGCSCKISDESSRPILDEICAEEQGEEESLNVDSTKTESEHSRKSEPVMDRGGFYEENYFLPLEIEETAKLLVNELIENVFATFRFSKKYSIEIPPLSVQQIEVKFIPKYKGFHHEMKYIQFEGCYNLEEQSIELMGDIKQIPLKIEPQVIDLKTCIINSGVYAGVFQVFNCNKGPYAIRLKIPSSLKNHAHVHPRTAIIQPFSCCDFSVRIYPRVTLSNDAPLYFDEDSGLLEFPIRVHPANTDSCKLDHIKIYVHALITTFNLELSPSVINFGTVTTLETIRTKVELTNHSLAIQEYGFLNLPKGIRVEPNMGFGRILPKETITLNLMYSPLADLFEKGWGEGKVEFDVVVTSITKYGGFNEKWEPEESYQEPEWRGEDYTFESPPAFTQEFSPENTEIQIEEESEESDLCDEDFSIEGEELMSKIQFQENKIRKFLKTEDDQKSGKSLSNKVNLQNEDQKKDNEQGLDTMSLPGEYENEKFREPTRPDMNLIKCIANVLGPRCQISETVIQLPATPINSFSLYRFQLNGMSETIDSSCLYGRKNASKNWGGKPKFKAAYEFVYSSPQIKLEPGSGFLKAGDSISITIISRPEVDSDESCNPPLVKKASDTVKSKLNKKESLISKTSTGIKQSNQKKNEVTPKSNRKFDETSQSGVTEATNPSVIKMKKSDLFLEDKSFREMIESSFFETKVRCVIKMLPCEDQSQMTETHDMVLICPTIKRHFTYLGGSQEINFGKVFIGTQSKIILQVQNVSFERISPSMTLLNPCGPFFCPGSLNKVEIDPEHIWRQPLTFFPEEYRQVDQFFEIYFGPTTVLLKVLGEAVEPQYKLLPTFSCCLLEAKLSSFEEIKLEIHNLSPVELFLQLETVFIREGFDLQIEDTETEGLSETKTKSDRREESKGKKSKNTESEKKKCRFWETTPESIIGNLEYFSDSVNDRFFTVVGLDEKRNFVVPPKEMNQIKIQFWAPADRGDKKYAAKYNLILGKRILLKEMIVLGRILK